MSNNFDFTKFDIHEFEKFKLFCKEVGLNFKFLDKEPTEPNDHKYCYEEAKLVKRALGVFHSQKKTLVIGNHIIHFVKNNSYPFERSFQHYDVDSIESFALNQENKYKKLFRRYEALSATAIFFYIGLTLGSFQKFRFIFNFILSHFVVWFLTPIVFYYIFYYFIELYKSKKFSSKEFIKRIEIIEHQLKDLKQTHKIVD